MKVLTFLAFTLAYAVDVVRSSLRVAWDVITPSARRRPAIMCVPLEVRTDIEIVWLANLVTFTPGTLALDVSRDRGVMVVHDMFAPSLDDARARIQRVERWVLRILR